MKSKPFYFAGALVCALVSGLSACGKSADSGDAANTAAVSSPTAAASPVNTLPAAAVPSTDAEKFSYMLGVQLASSVSADVVPLDTAFVAQGIEDTLKGKSLRIREVELQKMLHRYDMMLKQHQLKQQAVLEQQHGIRKQALNQSGQQFLNQNRTKPGVVETPTGVQYATVQAGQGKKPSLESSVRVHYTANFVDQDRLVEFDSSYSRQAPATYKIRDVIPGWQAVLPLMQTGGRYQVVVPASQGRGRPGITGGEVPDDAVLVYDMELLEVLDDQPVVN